MTESIFKTWRKSRELYLEYFNKYTLEQLNKIPEGFNNNLIWNIGHVIVAQQSLTYKLCKLDGHIPERLYALYKSGTKPEAPLNQAEVDELKGLLMAVIETTIEDYNNGKFTNFTEKQTGTGFHLGNLEDAFNFNNYHEGMHLGYMMSIRKFV